MPSRQVRLSDLTAEDLASEDSEEDPEYDPDAYDSQDSFIASDDDYDEDDIAEHRRLAREADRRYEEWFERYHDELEQLFHDQLERGRQMFGQAWCQQLRFGAWTRFMWQHT